MLNGSVDELATEKVGPIAWVGPVCIRILKAGLRVGKFGCDIVVDDGDYDEGRSK